jgi:hypothetical protein
LIIARFTFVFFIIASGYCYFSVIDYEDDQELGDVFDVFDMVEESEAEEITNYDVADNEDEVFVEDEDVEDGMGAMDDEIEDFQTDVVNEVDQVKVEPQKSEKTVQKKLPASISKYGLIFYPPHQYKKDDLGRMVCIHDKDKPKISTQNKPIHKDMECCLDPDEIPNPFCYYPREKYGKLLDDFERKKEKMLRRHHAGKGL